ncbi:MAG: hypothetical protein GY751_01520 [Bacteroidetes bacterium]|nr:hypothetical protein [Bacteroidota bacterium]
MVCMTFIAEGQESTIYSRYGLGLLRTNNFIPSRSMGGLGASFRSTEGVNFANPASYASLNLIAFEGGLTGVVNKVSSDFGSGRTGNVNLSYLNFAIPVKKDIWVSTIGIIPFSEKNYLVADTSDLSGPSSLANIFEGNGSIYTVYWGNGFKYKDFSIGFNLGYNFGNVGTTTLTTPLDDEGFVDNAAYSSFERSSLKTRGVYWNIGAQYSIPLSEKPIDKKSTKKLRLDVGIAYNASYNTGNNSKLTQSSYTIYNSLLALKNDTESYTDFLDDLIVTAAAAENQGILGSDIDTFKAPVSQSVNLRMPMNVNAGFIFVRRVREVDYWKAGFDFKWTPWSDYEGIQSSDGGLLANSWRVAAGGEILPIANGKSGKIKSKFLGQLKYRAGFYYERSPVIVGSTNIDEFGINFGIAIPIRLRVVNEEGFLSYRGVHAFSLGFEVGQRGTKSAALVKDNFVRINLGISLNDKWFVKRKYN